ncbi:MAG: hypothetical protein WEB62_10180 [Bacteroidota bacterium]
MGTFSNAVFGLVFLAIAFTNTILIFKLWGYPFDHEKVIFYLVKTYVK